MSKEIQNFIDELYELAITTKDEKMNESRIRQMARKEIMNFLMYLSASDGSIEVKEAIFIKDYFSEQISPEEICQRIEDDNLYSSAFEQKAPMVLKRLVNNDNLEYKVAEELKESKAEKYICLYEALGKEFIACDHEVSQCERDDLATYIGNMRSFYKANYKGPGEATEASHFEHHVSKTVESQRNREAKNENSTECEGEESLEELLMQLQALIGLNNVKATVNQLIHFNSVRQVRDQRGLKQLPITQHMVFYGNPGTGKTTVARLIARIYYHLGLLSKGHLVEVDRSGLVAGYVGHTALKVKDVVKEARGGVLFIDEAYALTYKRSENDFGWEAVDTLIKAMEDEREDLVVIVAGYPEPMKQFINSNPGLKSRFNRYLKFEDYTGEQLLQIYNKMATEAGYETEEAAMDCIGDFFEQKALNIDSEGIKIGFNASLSKRQPIVEGEGNFANARLVRNFLETAVMNQSDRLYTEGAANLSDNRLNEIIYEDVCNIQA
ncbi:MAG: AAA family ATPase [Blautia sp.]|nr:AAA family ATPase [Blautia sp.]